MLSHFKNLELLPVPQECVDVVADLIARYTRNRDLYRGASYNEARLRQEFLNPFFAALGWDMNNTRGHSEAYKDVIHEDTVRVEGVAKAPDYCFRYGGQRKFYLEAKAPSVNIKADVGPAYQLRRYGWSAKLPLSVLTDFEEFAVYDCRQKPSPTDPPAFARVLYLTYEEYLDNLQVLYSIFGHDAIPTGFFDRYAETGKGKRGTSTVDAEFLKEIERWRDELARHIALRNELSVYELNYAVQTIIDRLLFLRIAEDRGIEPQNRLQESAKRADVYADLLSLFHAADDKYNSGLFNFGKQGDQCTPNLAVENKVLKDLIASLYYPRSPYEFSVIGADILGAVYEQFLGKVIRLTKGGFAKVEEKPEVKKAGGVYYTPRYIVDYIVEHTVGEAVREAETPEQVAKLRVLDPACGSGSFLLGAYDWLLDWHLQYYTAHDPQKQLKARRPVLVLDSKGEWRLSTQERKRLLQANLYGVDIDTQAVEVTKLNLLLKCLEGETEQTLQTQQQMFQERVLPNIDGNIKCGNSLIGPDYYTARLDYDEDEQRRVNAFDWNREFKEIMGAGGFDCVIGNPPYIQFSMMEYADDLVNGYLRTNYSSSMARLNTFGLFIERVLRVCLGEGGRFSFIVPNTLLTQEYYQQLRRLMMAHKLEVLMTFTEMVFSGAVVETTVFVLSKAMAVDNEVDLILYENASRSEQKHSVKQNVFEQTHNNAFLVSADQSMIELAAKLKVANRSLAELANINQAIALSQDRAASLHDNKRADNYKQVLDGRDIQRYSLSWPGIYLDYNVDNIHSCKRTDIFEASSKILFRRVGDQLTATLDNRRYYALNTIVVVTWRSVKTTDLRYLLGLFNSQLLNVYYTRILKSTKRVFSEIQARQVGQLPIRMPDFSNPSDVAKHDKMVTLVQTMLDLNDRLPNAKTPRERDLIERQIADTDETIDQLVYELYDLTPEEIGIVRG